MCVCVCVVGLRIWLVLLVGVCVLSEFSSVQWRLFSLLYCIIIRQFLTICIVSFHCRFRSHINDRVSFKPTMYKVL